MAFQKLGNYRMCSVIDMVIQQKGEKGGQGWIVNLVVDLSEKLYSFSE